MVEIYRQALATTWHVRCSQEDREAMKAPPSSSSLGKASLFHLAFWSLMASCCSRTLSLGLQGGGSMVQECCTCSGLSVPADDNTNRGLTNFGRLRICVSDYRLRYMDITQRTLSIFSWHTSFTFPQNVPWQAALTSWNRANTQIIVSLLSVYRRNYLWHRQLCRNKTKRNTSNKSVDMRPIPSANGTKEFKSRWMAQRSSSRSLRRLLRGCFRAQSWRDLSKEQGTGRVIPAKITRW